VIPSVCYWWQLKPEQMRACALYQPIRNKNVLGGFRITMKTAILRGLRQHYGEKGRNNLPDYKTYTLAASNVHSGINTSNTVTLINQFSLALVEKLPLVHLLKYFRTFYETPWFITVFTRALH
jgi:hypothetical protein